MQYEDVIKWKAFKSSDTYLTQDFLNRCKQKLKAMVSLHED